MLPCGSRRETWLVPSVGKSRLCPRLPSLFKWEPEEERGCQFPFGRCSLFLIPVSFLNHSQKSGLMFLYQSTFLVTAVFTSELCRALAAAAGRSFPAAPGEPRSWERSREGGGAKARFGSRGQGKAACSGGTRALRGSPGLPQPQLGVPTCQTPEQRCSPHRSLKGLGTSGFQEIQGRGVWETLSVLGLGLFELDFGGPVSCSESLRFPAKTTNKTVGNLKYRNSNLIS